LYRVAQEALNNVIRHSRSKVVTLTVTKIQNRFYLTIQDSGIGFDTSNTSIGLGLLNMSERVKLVGGQLKIKSAPEEGTEISVEVTDDSVRRGSDDQRKTC
jgi:signal transduction histidine kinase